MGTINAGSKSFMCYTVQRQLKLVSGAAALHNFSEKFQRVTAACIGRKADSVHFAKNNLLTCCPTRGNLCACDIYSFILPGEIHLCVISVILWDDVRYIHLIRWFSI